MASPERRLAGRRHGLYDPKSGKPFSWKRAYSPVEGSAVSTERPRPAAVALLRPRRPVAEAQPETPNMDLPFSVKPDKKLSVQDVMDMTRDKSQGTVFDPGPGHPRRPVQEPELLPAGPGIDQRAQRRVHDGHPVPGAACPTRSAASSGSPSAPRTRPATCRFYAGHDRDPQIVHGRRPLDLQPRLGPLGLRLHRFPRPGRLLRGHRGRQDGPGEIRGRGSSPASPRSTRRPWRFYKKKPAKARRVPDRISPSTTPTTVIQRLVEARRRPPRQVQPARPVQRREARRPAAASRPPRLVAARPSGPSISSWSPRQEVRRRPP